MFVCREINAKNYHLMSNSWDKTLSFHGLWGYQSTSLGDEYISPIPENMFFYPNKISRILFVANSGFNFPKIKQEGQIMHFAYIMNTFQHEEDKI